MAELAAGHQEALQVLHRRLAPLVFHIACRSLDASAAEEITQDVFLRVWQKAASFDPARGAFRSWVLQIAHRRVLNELRERGRRPRLDGESEASLVDLSAHDAGPEAQVWAEYRRSVISRALSALPEEQGQALRLAFFQELTHEEVASFLEVPLGTVKGRIRLALQGAVELGPHANYRAERGGAMVVFTLTNVPAPPAGTTYRLWRLSSGAWQLLAEPAPDAQGHARVLIELAEPRWPEALRLTQEPRAPAGSAPAGEPVLAWSSTN